MTKFNMTNTRILLERLFFKDEGEYWPLFKHSLSVEEVLDDDQEALEFFHRIMKTPIKNQEKRSTP